MWKATMSQWANTKKTIRQTKLPGAGCPLPEHCLPPSLSRSSSQAPHPLARVYSGEKVQSSFSLECKGMLQCAWDRAQDTQGKEAVEVKWRLL